MAIHVYSMVGDTLTTIRRNALILLLFMICVTISASPLARDLGISFGHVGLFDNYYKNGLHVHLGIVKGISEHIELNVYTQNEITPTFMGDVQLGMDVGYSLLGTRWDRDGYAGSGVNMIVSVGALAGMHNPSNAFTIDSIVMKFTPLSVGTPHVGKRDRFLTMGASWNIHTRTFSFIWNFMVSDIFLLGSWRDADH